MEITLGSVHVEFCKRRPKTEAHIYRASERDIVVPILSVRPSVCPSNAGTVSKRMDTSQFSDDLVEAPF